MAWAITSSSLRTLFPPNPNGMASSRLMKIGYGEPIALSSLESRSIGVGPANSAVRGRARSPLGQGLKLTRIESIKAWGAPREAVDILRGLMTRAAITSIGRFLPARILDNKYFEQFVATNDEWIRTRTGIVTRHHAEPGTPTSDLATKAARECLERRGISSSEVDLIIVATVTPDMMFPATACVPMPGELGTSRYSCAAATL